MVYTILLGVLLLANLVFLVILVACGSAKKNDSVFEDISGIAVNPPNFIDVVRRKTLNIKLDEFTISIPQIGFLEGILRMREIQTAYLLLKKSANSDTDLIKVNETNLNEFVTFTAMIHNFLFNVSKKYVKRKELKKYNAKLKEKCLNDIEWVCEVTEQIFDFWTYVKKKVEFLASGMTIRQMYGEECTWESLSLDLQGNTYLLPRYGKSLNITQN